MTGGCLGGDRQHVNRLQRARRAGRVRIDYMPGDKARAVIEAKRATCYPGSVGATNSAVIDAIVSDWANLTGMKYCEVEVSKSPSGEPELVDTYARARMTSDPARSASARDFGERPGIAPCIAGARVRAYESGQQTQPERAMRRVTCGAKRHRDGQPCQAKSEPGKRRCRFHGGCSTGPKTEAGKVRALANLRQYRDA